MQLCIWYIVVALYPAIYFASIPWYFLLYQFLDKISRSPLIIFLNQNFIVRYGYFLFTAAYFSQAVSYTSSEMCISRSTLLRSLKNYSIYSVCTVIILGWFFGPLIYERINVSTGGYCNTESPDNGHTGQVKCTRIPGARWVDGFDASGHIYILLTMCLFLWKVFLENIRLRHSSEMFKGYTGLAKYGLGVDLDVESNHRADEREYTIVTKYSNVFRVVCLSFSVFLIGLWSMMFVVTCVFYHTLNEKLVLLIVAIAIFLLILFLKYNRVNSRVDA